MVVFLPYVSMPSWFVSVVSTVICVAWAGIWIAKNRERKQLIGLQCQ